MSSELPLVSVLMTAYNREKYIGAAIESVLASTYSNFELIITDDCSSDNTVQIARDYASKDPRVKVFVNEKNLGDYPNRNRAASHASGKYLKYIDADDFIYPWGLRLLVEMMEKFPEAGWGLCSLDQDLRRPFPFMLSPEEIYNYHYTGPGLFHKAPLSAIIRRDIFILESGFSPIRMAGDYEMWHRLGQKYRVVLMPHGLVWYREHGEQEMRSYYSYLPIYEGIKVKYLNDDNCPLDKSVVSSVLSKQKAAIRRQLLTNALKLRWKSMKTNIKQLQSHD